MSKNKNDVIILDATYNPSEEEIMWLDQWMDELKNNKFFPFHKVESILNDPQVNVVFIHGIMDDGKSFKHWNYNLEAYLRYGERTQVLYPETDSMKEEMTKFLEDLKDQCPKLWGEVKVHSLNDRGTQYGVFYKNHIFCYVGAISTMKKASRVSKIKRIVIDEYNQHQTRVRNIYIEQYNILLSRNMRNVKKIFLGNNVTTDHPLLHRYNIYELPDGITYKDIEYKHPVTKKWESSQFKVGVWNYSRPYDEIYEKYKDNPEYYELLMVDFGAHSFFNESRKDQRDFIVDLDVLVDTHMDLKYIIASRIGNLEMYKCVFQGEWYYYIRYDKKKEIKLGYKKSDGVISLVLLKDYEKSGYNADKEKNGYFYDLKGSKKHRYRYQNASVAAAFQEQLRFSI